MLDKSIGTINTKMRSFHIDIVTRIPQRDGFGIFITSILIAAILWLIMFRMNLIPFWPLMILSTSVLAGFALLYARNYILFRIQLIEIIIGILSSFVLYGVFYIGNIAIRQSLPFASQEIGTIYLLRENYKPWFLTLTLLLPIGPGEELFWRGMVLGRLCRELPLRLALLLSSLIYAAVHIPSGNLTLIGAAFAGGIFWSILYIWRRNILAPVISHTLWDILVFVYFPFN